MGSPSLQTRRKYDSKIGSPLLGFMATVLLSQFHSAAAQSIQPPDSIAPSFQPSIATATASPSSQPAITTPQPLPRPIIPVTATHRLQPNITTLQSHPSRRSASIISMPEGSGHCAGDGHQPYTNFHLWPNYRTVARVRRVAR